jgi:hypothetical protein
MGHLVKGYEPSVGEETYYHQDGTVMRCTVLENNSDVRTLDYKLRFDEVITSGDLGVEVGEEIEVCKPRQCDFLASGSFNLWNLSPSSDWHE